MKVLNTATSSSPRLGVLVCLGLIYDAGSLFDLQESLASDSITRQRQMQQHLHTLRFTFCLGFTYLFYNSFVQEKLVSNLSCHLLVHTSIFQLTLLLTI
jgi:hypothetical protein